MAFKKIASLVDRGKTNVEEASVEAVVEAEHQPITVTRIAFLMQEMGYRGKVIHGDDWCWVESATNGNKFSIYSFWRILPIQTAKRARYNLMAAGEGSLHSMHGAFSWYAIASIMLGVTQRRLCYPIMIDTALASNWTTIAQTALRIGNSAR